MTSLALQPEVAVVRPKPFLKWAGGKTQLVPEIMARLPDRFGRYHEPFLGGGAVFFAVEPQRACLSDINGELVATYSAIRDNVGAVMRALERHSNTEEHFYKVRATNPANLTKAQAAARMIFLNRTCFNGLYRVNRKGQFNVPFGRYKNPNLCNKENLVAVSEALNGVAIENISVFDAARRVRRGDFVYLDPPYDPISPTASFTSYTAGGFTREDQKKLAEMFAQLASRGAYVMLSNSDTPYIRSLYKKFRVEQVFARRAINSRSDRRGPVSEVLVCSW